MGLPEDYVVINILYLKHCLENYTPSQSIIKTCFVYKLKFLSIILQSKHSKHSFLGQFDVDLSVVLST